MWYHTEFNLNVLYIYLRTRKMPFCGSYRKCAQNAFPPIFERGLGRVSKWQVCGRGKKELKNPFLQNLHRDITVRMQCDKDGA